MAWNGTGMPGGIGQEPSDEHGNTFSSPDYNPSVGPGQGQDGTFGTGDVSIGGTSIKDVYNAYADKWDAMAKALSAIAFGINVDIESYDPDYAQSQWFNKTQAEIASFQLSKFNPSLEISNSYASTIFRNLMTFAAMTFVAPIAGYFGFSVALRTGLNATIASFASSVAHYGAIYGMNQIGLSPVQSGGGYSAGSNPMSSFKSINHESQEMQQRDSSGSAAYLALNITGDIYEWAAGGKYYNDCMAGGDMMNPTGLIEKENILTGQRNTSDISFLGSLSAPYSAVAGGSFHDIYAGSRFFNGAGVEAIAVRI